MRIPVLSVVIAPYHDHIIKGWWTLKSVGWELPAKAPMDPVSLLSQVYIYYLYSRDIITY